MVDPVVHMPLAQNPLAQVLLLLVRNQGHNLCSLPSLLVVPLLLLAPDHSNSPSLVVIPLLHPMHLALSICIQVLVVLPQLLLVTDHSPHSQLIHAPLPLNFPSSHELNR